MQQLSPDSFHVLVLVLLDGYNERTKEQKQFRILIKLKWGTTDFQLGRERTIEKKKD